MSQPFDASKSLTTLEQDSTIIAVIEMSQSKWLVAAITELRARAAGVITVRSIEVGQVVKEAAPAFTLAQDGERECRLRCR